MKQMNKLFTTSLFLILFCGFSFEKDNNMPIDKDKFFIKDLNYRDFSCEEVSNWVRYIEKLQLADSCHYLCRREKYDYWVSSAEYYYYSIIDTTNYYSYVYFYFAEYEQAFLLINYDKNGKYIDDVTISSLSGDAGYFFNSDGLFVNDSVIIRTDTEMGCDAYLQDAKDTITSIKNYKILIKKDGHIQTETLR
jgi:hypothetical protein